MASLRRFTWLGLVLILVGCRQDMHDQPRMKTYAMSDFYADLRSERPPVEGTVARGQLHEDSYFYTGKISESRRLHTIPGPGECGEPCPRP